MERDDIRDKALGRTKEKLKESVDRDRYLIKAAKFLDQLNQDLDPEVERLRDWYSLHFPELEGEIGDDHEFMKILERGVQRDELEPFKEMAEESTGAPLADEDREMLEKTVAFIEDKYKLREELEDYIESVAKQEMPNLSTLLGPLLATRLMAIQGSLESLAKQPSSTIQMLGAEKALFRYLHGEGTPPKHGVLFQHPFVNSLPNDERGKMARFLANKAAMAARLDYYGDKDKGEELHKEAQEKYDELKN